MVLAIFIGIPLIAGVIAGVAALTFRAVSIPKSMEMNLLNGTIESNMDMGAEMESMQDTTMMAPDMVSP